MKKAQAEEKTRGEEEAARAKKEAAAEEKKRAKEEAAQWRARVEHRIVGRKGLDISLNDIKKKLLELGKDSKEDSKDGKVPASERERKRRLTLLLKHVQGATDAIVRAYPSKSALGSEVEATVHPERKRDITFTRAVARVLWMHARLKKDARQGDAAFRRLFALESALYDYASDLLVDVRYGATLKEHATRLKESYVELKRALAPGGSSETPLPG